MARNFFRHTVSAKVALVADTVKTVIQIVSDANVPVVITKVIVAVDDDFGSADTLKTELTKQTTAGTMTGRNPSPIRAVVGTLQATGNENASAEPTGDGIKQTINYTAPAAYEDLETVLTNEIEVGGGERLGAVLTSSIAANCTVTFEGEE